MCVCVFDILRATNIAFFSFFPKGIVSCLDPTPTKEIVRSNNSTPPFEKKPSKRKKESALLCVSHSSVCVLTEHSDKSGSSSDRNNTSYYTFALSLSLSLSPSLSLSLSPTFYFPLQKQGFSAPYVLHVRYILSG